MIVNPISFTLLCLVSIFSLSVRNYCSLERQVPEFELSTGCLAQASRFWASKIHRPTDRKNLRREYLVSKAARSRLSKLDSLLDKFKNGDVGVACTSTPRRVIVPKTSKF